MSLGFTTQQIDHICYQIGEWYLKMKPLLQVQHNLGFMKEELKNMICGNEYTDNSELLKSEIEKKDDIIKFLENGEE